MINILPIFLQFSGYTAALLLPVITFRVCSTSIEALRCSYIKSNTYTVETGRQEGAAQELQLVRMEREGGTTPVSTLAVGTTFRILEVDENERDRFNTLVLQGVGQVIGALVILAYALMAVFSGLFLF